MADRYVVARRRDSAEAAPEEWLARLDEVEGVEVLGSYGGRAQIACEPDAATALRDLLGEGFHLEPIIEHYPSDDDPPALPPGRNRDPRRPQPL